MSFRKRLIKSLRRRVFAKNYSQKDGFYSQSGQDIFVVQNLFKDKKTGVFVDIGAHDGITFSNTYYLEKNLGWKGFCFEPNPDVFKQLVENRTCECFNLAIADFTGPASFLKIDGHCQMLSGLIDKYNPEHLARIDDELKEYGGQAHEIKTTCAQLDDILNDFGIQEVDYLSIDTEGSELNILKTIDFEHRHYGVVSVENNYDDNRIAMYMKTKNFKLDAILQGDEFYINGKGVDSNPRDIVQIENESLCLSTAKDNSNDW